MNKVLLNDGAENCKVILSISGNDEIPFDFVSRLTERLVTEISRLECNTSLTHT